MKKSFLTIAIVFITLLSCKDKEAPKEDENVDSTELAVKDYYVVTMDLVATKNDSFHVYYTEDGSANFTEENSIWCEFKGSPNSQKLVFKIPEERTPNQLRLDFGVNKEQGDVKVNNIEIVYKDKVFNVLGTEITKYFTPNTASTIIDASNQTIKPIKSGFNTSLYPIETLKPELEKLLK